MCNGACDGVKVHDEVGGDEGGRLGEKQCGAPSPAWRHASHCIAREVIYSKTFL